MSMKCKPNVLIIGDSYSEGGLWIDDLSKMISLGEIINLGVSSATLKDVYSDREMYPYTSRPLSNDNRGGNLNTFACQVEKLKRLMSGEDLDDGENKVFADSQPDIIIIEGGINDSLDSSTDLYMSQIYKTKEAYIKSRYHKTAKRGFIKIPTHYQDTDRTCFAGSIRYLYGVLHEMFPKAFFFFVTPSGLSYMSGKEHFYLQKGEQLKYAASLLGIPVIDWGLNSRLSICDNVVLGSGTQEDPYIYDTGNEYTFDSLHPNRNGAHLLAMEVAKVLTSYNLTSYN